MTFGTGAIQFSKFVYTLKNTLGKIFRSEKSSDKGALSPFEAMSTALAATVGTGNISGVAVAITMGGPGAIFWMWIAALVGMATKYSEIFLAIHYRERNKRGEWSGGPMYYIKNGLGKRWQWLSVMFCLFAVLASFGIGNIAQANSIVSSLNELFFAFSADPTTVNTSAINLVTGIILALAVAAILLGGLKRIGAVASKLVPFMAAIYILGGIIFLICRFNVLGDTFALIFSNAFGLRSVMGGAVGYLIAQSIKNGFARGIFSNEAGLGSAPIAHSTADTKSPVQQGIYGILEVFLDTIVICSISALVILSSGLDIEYGVKQGVELTTAAFATLFGAKASSLVMFVALTCFAFTTLLAWSFYGARCMEYLFGEKSLRIYQVVFVLIVVAGATMDLSLAWDISDTMNGLMALPNLIALALLSPVVFKGTKEFFASEKRKKK